MFPGPELADPEWQPVQRTSPGAPEWLAPNGGAEQGSANNVILVISITARNKRIY